MSKFEVLLLNANYEPLNVCHCRRALTLVLIGKAEVIVDSQAEIHTSSGSIPAPSVVRMRYQVKRPMPTLRLSRHSVLARDNYQCQYCGVRRDLTIDHIYPKWMGGGNTWENLVTCCRKCNLKKGSRLPEEVGMNLRSVPRRPKYIPYLSLQQYIKAIRREDWQYYLPIFEEFAIEDHAYAS